MSTVVLEGGPLWLFLLGTLIEFGAVVLLTVIWCKSMERAIRACDNSSRKMQPGQSWLVFVPLFGFIWQFVAVNNVSLSLATEYHLRGWKSDEGRPGIETGLIACVAILVVFLLRTLIVLHPGISVMMSLGVCICMYMHRERLNAFTERLEVENKKAQQSFTFDSGPYPFSQQSFSQQSFGQQSLSPQPFNQQPFAQPNYNQQPYGQQNIPQPSYNQQYPPQGFPQYNQPQNPYQPPQNIPPVQQYTQQQYTQQQYVQQQAQHHQQHQQKKQEEQRPAGGWDGMTTWEAPEGWKHPDLSDPREYFS